jgi:hypothetical protein
LKTHLLAALAVLTLGSTGLFADTLTWGGTYIADWDGFGTSPYTATDTSATSNQGIQLFCLDFNDEIAPPDQWQANVYALSSSSVTNNAQYGGSYNNLLDTAASAANKTAPQVYPFVFAGDPSAPAGYQVTLTQDPYTRYLEAAWLFTDIESAVSAHPEDVNTDMIAQVAAWDLFVNSSNVGTLTSDIANYGGTPYTFQNYLGSTSVGGLTFEQAVDVALADAQNAVVNNHWDGGDWSLVTATPAWVVGYGRPVQEFLTPVPEPQSVVLLGTVIAIWVIRRGWLPGAAMRKKFGSASRT